MRRSALAALAAAAACGASVLCGGASAQGVLPNGPDTLMPRYYDYRAPRVFYWDQGPVGYRAYGYVYPPYALYAPAPSPPVAYAPPAYAPAAGVYGYAPQAVAPAPPGPLVAPRPICGVYRYWNGERCMDARGY
jgi:hypothetical protein